MKPNGSNSAGLPAYPGYASYVYDTETVGAKANWTGTATTRLGLAKDNWMLYGKAGAAWANYTYSLAHAGGYYVNYYTAGEYPPFAFGATTFPKLELAGRWELASNGHLRETGLPGLNTTT